MNSNPMRNYNCKNEELPVICEYALYSLQRDKTDFEAFSPKFNEAYIAAFADKIAAVNALVNPKLETEDLKATTARLYAAMEGLLDPLARLEGYLKLAKQQIPVSAKDFGITELRKKLHSRDAEGVLYNLNLVSANIEKFKDALAAAGCTDALAAQFADAVPLITADNEQQYALMSVRKELVQNNVGALNELYAQLQEICEVGKILYKHSNPEKAQEYTFTFLLKRVRHVSKNKSNAQKSAIAEDK